MRKPFTQQVDVYAKIFIAQLEKKKLWFLCGFSMLYLIVTCLLAWEKLLWNDELFTLYISRLFTLNEVWSALLTGAEQLPPFFYVITRTSLALFGVNNISIRLPEVLGFWVMSLCLFRFVSVRSSALYGYVAMLFPLVTGAYSYAYEARPYALVLGFSGLALVCWQSAAEGRYRKLSLICLAVSLAAAVSNHYYAVFVFLPLALGELVRSFSLRRVDTPIWGAFGVAVTPLLLFLPLIERARNYSLAFWAQTDWMAITKFYYFLLAPALLPLMVIPILLVFDPATHSQPQRSSSAPPLHEVAAAFGFITIPVVAFALAKLVTGAFTDRYALPAVIGFSIFIAFAAYKLLDGRAIMAAALLLSLCGGFMMIGVKSFQETVAAGISQAETNKFLQSERESGLPIVASDPHTFMMLAHYGSPDVASRVLYLADPAASMRYLGHNSVEKGMLDLLKPWFHLPIEEYGSFVASPQRFLVYGSPGHFLNWLMTDLAISRRHIQFRGRNKDAVLFLVSPGYQSEGDVIHGTVEASLFDGGKTDARPGRVQRR